MKAVLSVRGVLFVLALAIVSCNLVDVNPGAHSLPAIINTPSTNKTVDTAIGGNLYRTLCARCHGDSAQGTTDIPRAIAGFSGITYVVRTGFSGMPTFPNLSDSDIVSIEKYIAYFRQAGLDTMTGVNVFHKYCATCHGDSAQGLTGKGVGIQGDSMNVTAYVRNGGKIMPKFSFVTNRQIQEIKVWLASFQLPTDGQGLYRMFCASCHGDQAQGLRGSGIAIQADSENVTNFVRNGGRTMQKLTSLTDPQIAQIKNYLMTYTLPTDGTGLYKLYCSTCHGDSAQGISGFGSGIQGDTANVTPYVHSGGKTMPAIKSLSYDQIALIKGYLSSFILPSDGAGLFALFCASCHGPTAQGIVGKGVAIQGDTANVANFVQNGGKTMPKFSQLTPAHIAQLKIFLNSFTIPQDGSGLFKLYCSSCHGDSAQGIVGKGTGIQGDTANVTKYVRNGGVTMPKILTLTDTQIVLIKSYLSTFIIPTDGPTLFRLYCASCHGNNAEGLMNSGPALQGDSANVVVMVKNGGRTMQKFSSLTDPQITAIKQFLGTFAIPADGVGLYKLYCATCHGDNAQGVTGSGSGIQGDTGNVLKFVKNGGTKMPKILALSNAQIALLKSYLGTFLIPTDGPGLFKLYCSTCHGDSAQGIIGNGPGIKGDTANVSAYVKNGGKTMPKQPLSDAQIAQVKKYLATFAIPLDGPGLYKLYCASCHGDSAVGISGKGPGIQRDTANVIAFVTNGGKTMPKQSLTSAQIVLIKSYLGSFTAPVDGPGLYGVYCKSCHGANAQGVLNSGVAIQADSANVATMVANGGRTMQKFLTLTPPQIIALKAYLGTFTLPSDGPGFYKLYCGFCHGDSAQGITGGGPGIQGDTANVTRFVTLGGTTMPKYLSLGNPQIALIKQYLGAFIIPTDGKSLFKLYCSSCHGDTAQGLAGKGPSIQRDTANVTRFVTLGGTTMPKQSINVVQIAAVKTYLMTFGLVTDGATLYGMYCVSCHGAQGAGMKNSGVAIQGDSANVSSMLANGGRTMTKFAFFSPVQVNGIKAYIGSFPVTRTPPGEFKLYCSFCHGDSATGIVGSGIAIQGDTGNVDKFVLNGGTTMPKYLSLGNSDLALLKQFLAQWILPSDGAGIFKMKCASCHGDSAQGMTGSGPSIQRDSGNVTKFVTQGGTTMPKQTLDTAQISAVKTFLMSFAAVYDGPTLYTMYCSNCHGSAGQGGVGPAIQQDTTNMTSNIMNGGIKMPKITALNASQISLVGSYIMTLALPTTGDGLYMRYCAKCHGSNAMGDSVTYVGLVGGHGPVWTAVNKGYSPRARSLPSMPAIPALNQTQSNLIGTYLQGVTYPASSGRNTWVVNCMYCHGANKISTDDYNTQTRFENLVARGNSDGMPASTWISTVEADTLYYWLKH